MTGPLRQAGVSRRGFLLGVAAVAGGGLALTWATREQDRLATSPDILEPNAFLQVTPDGRFIFQLDKVEMGQGTMTGLLTLVAEELDVDPARFEVQFAPVRSIFQRPMQMTGQSRSMVDSWDVLRETGATGRAMLLEAAALDWDVPAGELTTDDGVIIHDVTGKRGPYSDFAALAATLSPPWNAPLKDPAEYRWIGTAVPRVDLHDKVTGKAVFGIDVQPDAALTAVVARIPEMGATLSGFSTAAAESVRGVRGFVELPYGVAAVADNFWAARKAAALIELAPRHNLTFGIALAVFGFGFNDHLAAGAAADLTAAGAVGGAEVVFIGALAKEAGVDDEPFSVALTVLGDGRGGKHGQQPAHKREIGCCRRWNCC